ncbi:aldo/keto reductase [Brachybacterium sp. YJGR34]|uniref:aldo/keto reductase n=1 Tax=Brachybacterium sp. YJGR34 TaxID=2059911 RepID=UPI000E0AA29E|nr:aldo/keto reductase [Brachybacterium sp. YJGR34]
MSIELPAFGVGAAQMGNLYRPTPEDVAQAALAAAWDGGLRYYDTAPHYGMGLSERRLGAMLRTRERSEFVLSSKVGRLIVDDPAGGSGDDLDNGFAVPDSTQRVWDVSAGGIRRSIEESLERMGLDRLDIAYLHDPEEGPEDQAFAEALPALIALREEGVVRAVGVGSKSDRALARFTATGALDLVMISGRYTLLEQPAARELLPLCERHGTRAVAVSVYNSGILSRETPSRESAYEYGQVPEAVWERAMALAALCEEHGVTLPQAATHFPLRHPAVVNVTLGMRTPEHVASNLARMEARIPSELWEAIDAL